MFDKLIEKLHGLGIDAHNTVYGAGLYYDGFTQHGELIHCLSICNEYHRTGISGEQVHKIINQFLRYHAEYDVIARTHPYYNMFDIALKADIERGEALQRVADVFLEAFWQTIHDDPTAREHNARRACEAGKSAIAAM